MSAGWVSDARLDHICDVCGCDTGGYGHYMQCTRPAQKLPQDGGVVTFAPGEVTLDQLHSGDGQHTEADVDYALMVDAYEKQRTAAYRAVNRDVYLLLDAQAALRDGRLDVVKEFLQRVGVSLINARMDLRHPPAVES